MWFHIQAVFFCFFKARVSGNVTGQRCGGVVDVSRKLVRGEQGESRRQVRKCVMHNRRTRPAADVAPAYAHGLYATIPHVMSFDHERSTWCRPGRGDRISDVDGTLLMRLFRDGWLDGEDQSCHL